MPLLSPEHFSAVLSPLLGKRVGYVRPVGNTGDRLIDMATFQLFAEFGVRWRMATPDAADDCEELVFAGGGNMGRLYPANWRLRTDCLSLGVPITILPQSFTTPENRPFARVFVRERRSLQIRPDAVLAPDMALGLRYQTATRVRHEVGIFPRRDCESRRSRTWLRRTRRDPARLCRTPVDYLELAAQYARIVTDRLHFAIAGLIVGRRVTLVANSYFKNAAMHETWLQNWGCEFTEAWPESEAGWSAAYPLDFRKWISHAPSSHASTLPNM